MSDATAQPFPDGSGPAPRPRGESEKSAVPPAAQNTQTGAARWQAPAAEQLADSFPGLKVSALAAVGGMGAVYRAEQSRLGRTVAVKVLPTAAAPDSDARDRFEREARILSGLNHPHILHIHDFGALPDGTLYLVTEWAGGGDLSRLLNHEAHAPARVLAWVKQISAALDAAHARGVIHRDLKPPNVLVHEDGRLTLADFGLAHAAGGGFTAALTLPGAIFGTFEYMAPEQMESAGHATPATDLYALGVMTYQMLTGRVPRGAYARPSRLVRVPPEVDGVLDSAMASDPARRPKSGADFAQALERALLAPVRRRQRQLIGLGVALVGLALAWARAEIIRAEREAAAAEARLAATLAEQRLVEMRRALQAATERRPAEEFDAPAEPLDLRLNPFASPPAATSGETAPAAPAPEPAAKSDTVVAPSEATPAASAEPAAPVEHAKLESAAPPWIWVISDVKPATDALAGEWRVSRGELVSGEGLCVLTLPVRLAINYDVAIEFTRNSGQNSIAVFVPTLSGVGTFEVDAWDLGVAGLQTIDGRDLRRSSRFFPARLRNGEKHRLILEVRGRRVTAAWDGEPRMSWDLSASVLRIPASWQVRPEVGLGLGTWSSPSTFHRIAYRSWPADPEP